MKRSKQIIVVIALLVICASLLVACNIPDELGITRKYSVTFDANGGIFLNGESVFTTPDLSQDSHINQPSSPIRSGYEFGGWSTSKDSLSKLDFNSISVDSDMTLYAIWELKQLKRYSVTFDANGGLFDDNTSYFKMTDLEYECNISMPAEPTRADYYFVGWSQNRYSNDYWNFFSDFVVKDMTLYARWERKPVARYIVTFDANGGLFNNFDTKLKADNILSGSKLSRPITPTLTGYKLVGWSTSSYTINCWNFDNNTVDSDMTLYAIWERIPIPTYTVSFSANGGKFNDLTSIYYANNLTGGSKLSAPSTPTRSGFEFLGWSTVSTTNLPWDFDKDVVTKNLNLYAIWRAVPNSNLKTCVSQTFYGEWSVYDNYGDYTANGAGYIANNNFIKIDISQLDMQYIKNTNSNIEVTIEMSIKEKDDGYQEIYLYNEGVNKTSVQKGYVSAVANVQVEHGVGKTNKNYARYRLTAVVYPSAISGNALWLAFDAHGSLEDTWYAKDIKVTLCQTSSSTRSMYTTKI